MKAEALIDAILEASPLIRYGAVHPGAGEPVFRARLGSEFAYPDYEERLVYPTMIDLMRRQGELSGRRLDHIIISFEGRVVVLFPLQRGHLTVGVDPGGDPAAIAAMVWDVAESVGVRFLAPHASSNGASQPDEQVAETKRHMRTTQNLRIPESIEIPKDGSIRR
jgi:hypothetical protein